MFIGFIDFYLNIFVFIFLIEYLRQKYMFYDLIIYYPLFYSLTGVREDTLRRMRGHLKTETLLKVRQLIPQVSSALLSVTLSW